MEPSVFVAFVINLMPLEPVPVWTPFDCCLILIQRNKIRKKGTKPREVREEKPNRRIRKTERNKDRERER